MVFILDHNSLKWLTPRLFKHFLTKVASFKLALIINTIIRCYLFSLGLLTFPWKSSSLHLLTYYRYVWMFFFLMIFLIYLTSHWPFLGTVLASLEMSGLCFLYSFKWLHITTYFYYSIERKTTWESTNLEDSDFTKIILA